MKLLNVVAEDSWVGWDSFKSEMFFTSIPCTQDLLISPPIFPENGFEKYEESKSDFSIFLKDPSQTKKNWGGSFRFKVDKKRYKAVQFRVPSIEYLTNRADSFKSKLGVLELPQRF